MIILNNISEINNALASVVLIGKFDGLHLGHKTLFEKMKNYQSQGLRAVVVTFDPLPEEFLFHQKIPLIMSMEEKRNIFNHLGVDVLVQLPANRETLDFGADFFLSDILIDRLGMKVLVAGADVTFGKQKRGDIKYLREQENILKFNLDIADEVNISVDVKKFGKYSGEIVSSTMIRAMIENGDIHLANNLMYHPFSISGSVVSGRQLGRTIGFPTINILPESDKIIPKKGVYMTKLYASDRVYNSVTNIGRRPTVSISGEQIVVESHILDRQFNKAVRFDRCQIAFLEFVRGEKKFDGIDKLKEAIARDVKTAAIFFAESDGNR